MFSPLKRGLLGLLEIAYGLYAVAAFLVAGLLVFALVLLPLGITARRHMAHLGARTFFRLAGMPLRVLEREHLPAGPCVVVANHASYLDGVVLKAARLPGFGGIPLFDVIRFFFQQVKTVGMTERASSIAFNFVMAIPPLIIFLFTLIPLMPISNQFEQELYNLIRSVVPGEKDHAVLIHFLEDFINNPRNDLLSLGFVLSIFFSSNAVMGVMRSFDKNYIGFKKRTDLQKRLTAIKITFVLLFFVILTVLLLIAQGRMLTWLGIENKWVRGGIENLRWVLVILLLFACISYIYRAAPAVHKKWPWFSPDSFLATVLMLLFSAAFS